MSRDMLNNVATYSKEKVGCRLSETCNARYETRKVKGGRSGETVKSRKQAIAIACQKRESQAQSATAKR
jgi:hypothetical protein